MSFEAFNKEEVHEIINHTLECMSKESPDEQVQKQRAFIVRIYK